MGALREQDLPFGAERLGIGPRRGETAPGRRSPAIFVGLALLVAAGAFLRLWHIGHQGFWYDEGNTAQLVSGSMDRMLRFIPRTESTPPLYYLLAWGWAHLFGGGPGGLRSLSALFGIATIPTAYLAGERFLRGARGGFTVAALTAFNPFLIWYAQEARSYALFALLSAGSLVAFAGVLERPTGRRLTGWALCGALALLTHYYAIVVLIPQALWLLWVHRAWRPGPRRRGALSAVGALAAVGVLLLPLALQQSSTRGDAWIAASDLGLRLRQVIPQLLIGVEMPDRTLIKAIALALATLALVRLAWAARTRRDGATGWPGRAAEPWGPCAGALLAGGLALGGFLLALGFAAGGTDTLITRNLIGLWTEGAVCVAGGLLPWPAAPPRQANRAETGDRAIGPRYRGRAGRLLGPGAALVTGGLCLIGVIGTVAIATTPDLQRPDWRPVASILGARPRLGHGARERVILLQHDRELLPLSLYLPGLRFLGPQVARGVREIDVVGTSSPQQRLCWWGAACNLIPSGIQPSYPVPGFRELWRRRVARFTIIRLVALRPQRVTPGKLAGALQLTSLPRDGVFVQR